MVNYRSGTEFVYTQRFLPSAALVVEGLIQVFFQAPDGRETTARYDNVGDLIGLTGVLTPDGESQLAERLNWRVVHDVAMLSFALEDFQDVFDSDPAFARSLCRYLFTRFIIAQEVLAGEILLPVRSRVAGHLLDLAHRHGSALIVTAKTRRLAAASGSVREVVARALREFEQAEIIKRQSAKEYVLLDTAALHRIASGDSTGT